MDWLRLCLSAAASLDEERAALEARIAADPNDIEARVLLIGALGSKFDEEHQSARGVHLVWLATYRPEIGLGGFGRLIAAYAPREHPLLQKAWRAAVATPDVGTDVLENAATFLGFEDAAEGEALYRRAIACEPGSYHWRERVAYMLMRQDRPVEAITELQGALERAGEDWVTLSLSLDLLEAVVMSKQWGWAVELAQRILADNETVTRTFQNYGNAIHNANIALGWAAHARGEHEEAAFYLQEAAKTPGSPQLNSFGPNRELAKTLFEAGQRAAVKAYFVECRRFWKEADDALAALEQLP